VKTIFIVKKVLTSMALQLHRQSFPYNHVPNGEDAELEKATWVGARWA